MCEVGPLTAIVNLTCPLYPRGRVKFMCLHAASSAVTLERWISEWPLGL